MSIKILGAAFSTLLYNLLYKDTHYDCCQQASLQILDGSGHTPLSEGIPYTRQDCFELVDWTGRALRADKRGAIDEQFPLIHCTAP